MKLFTSISISFVIAAAACGSCGDAKNDCDPADYPICRGSSLVDCEGGVEVMADSASALCVVDGEVPCDPATFEPTCGDDGYQVCGSNGVTETTNCPADRVCGIGAEGPICLPTGESTCDPATDEATCDGDNLVACGDTGVTSTSSCAPDTCRIGRAGAVCVPIDAEECDFSGTQCFSGDVQECVDGFARAVTSCGAAGTCVIDECFPAGTLTCGAASKPRCGANGRMECDLTYRVYRDAPCPTGTCAADPLTGAVCLPADEEACDAAAYAPNCVDAATARRCIESVGMTLTTTCAAGESCQTTDTGAWCAPDGAEACDPATFEATCNGSTATTCDIQRHVVVSTACGAGTVCLDDDLGNLYKFAGCYPDGLPDCTEPSHQGCADSDTFQWCVGGKLIKRDCDPGEVCYGGGLRAECRPAAAPACSVFDYVETCEGPYALNECFAGYEITTRCDRVGGRCDATAGACAY